MGGNGCRRSIEPAVTTRESAEFQYYPASMARTTALAAGLIAATAFVALPAHATPGAEQVPVANGRYGFVDVDDPDMFLMKVRDRRIINPRFAITVTCRHSDGTQQDVAYGPTSSDPLRKERVPRNGSRTLSWHQAVDSSLIPDAEITVGVTFRRSGRVLASAEVSADYTVDDPEGGLWRSQCYGTRSFELSRGPLRLPR